MGRDNRHFGCVRACWSSRLLLPGRSCLSRSWNICAVGMNEQFASVFCWPGAILDGFVSVYD